MHAPEGAGVVPLFEWNKPRFVVNKPHVDHWLNGKKVLGYGLWSEGWKRREANCRWNKMPHYNAAKSNIQATELWWINNVQKY